MAHQYKFDNHGLSRDQAGIPTTLLTFDPRTATYGEKQDRGAAKFICGPIPYGWIQKANTLPGKATAVALSLWFLHGVKRSTTFRVTAEAQQLSGCSRQAFARGLRALGDANLITVQSKPGARPLVTLIA